MFLCEYKQWLKTITLDEIKNSFKCARFIERVVETAGENNCSEELQEVVKIEISRQPYCDLELLGHACDHLLIVIFKTKQVSKDNVDISMRIYQTMLPKERLQGVIKDLLTKSLAFQSISRFALQNLDKDNSKELQYRLLLNKLTESKDNVLSETIDNMLSGYKIKENLMQLLGVISLATKISLKENNTQIEVANLICQKLQDKSDNNSKFIWSALLKYLDHKILMLVSEKYADFLNKLIDVVIFIASLMILDRKKNWVVDENIPNSCANVSYYDLVIVLNVLSNSKNKLIINEKLEEAGNILGSEIFKDILKDINC